HTCATTRELDFFNSDVYYNICTVVDSSYFASIGNTCTVNSDVGWRIHKHRSFCIVVFDYLYTVGKVSAFIGSSVGTDDGAGALVAVLNIAQVSDGSNTADICSSYQRCVWCRNIINTIYRQISRAFGDNRSQIIINRNYLRG